jgi:23S rRNA-/tRNA-specific pseudouridylate synthase
MAPSIFTPTTDHHAHRLASNDRQGMNAIPWRVAPYTAFAAKGLAKHHHVSRSSTTTTVSLLTPATTLAASRREHSSLLLPPPAVLFSNNHLLVVNKPPGWCAAPNADASIALLDDDDGASRIGTPPTTGKCLLSHLQHLQLGGGSQRTFLVPVHRLDQPCSGVQLYAKTSRAASRIQRQWRDLVKKSYLAVLDSPEALQGLVRQASPASGKGEEDPSNNNVEDGAADEARWYELEGYLERRRTSMHRSKENHSTSSLDSNNRGWSVNMIPALSSQMNELDLRSYSDDRRYRLCSIRFQVLRADRGLIRIATRDGARHVIRSLLSSFGAPLAGDLRYGGASSSSSSRRRAGKTYAAARPLPDRSVALHAERLEIVCVPPSDARAKASFLDDLRGPYVAPTPTPVERLVRNYHGLDKIMSVAALNYHRKASATTRPVQPPESLRVEN